MLGILNRPSERAVRKKKKKNAFYPAFGSDKISQQARNRREHHVPEKEHLQNPDSWR